MACETGKRVFSSEGQARRGLRSIKHPHGNLNVYRCGNHWHLGHPDPLITKRIKSGVVGK